MEFLRKGKVSDTREGEWDSVLEIKLAGKVVKHPKQ